jgi:hypothetical protein
MKFGAYAKFQMSSSCSLTETGIKNLKRKEKKAFLA